MEFKKQSNARQRKRFLPYDLNPNVSVQVGIQVVLFVGRSDEARRMLVAASAVGVQLSYGGVWMLDFGKWSLKFRPGDENVRSGVIPFLRAFYSRGILSSIPHVCRFFRWGDQFILSDEPLIVGGLIE
ncbi:unnamed protein product [Nesidiocoris tenuis]|uniref:Uncharacterized protein n=1 Tax=Nesidiocoris tenuis TaxID=355587 RepID=A0A6H5GZV1_9HEMI|nr:unnamed protein product [Nesidiocoris tenuis]